MKALVLNTLRNLWETQGITLVEYGWNWPYKNRKLTLLDFKYRFEIALNGIYKQDELSSLFFTLTQHSLNFSRLDFALNPNYSLTKNQEKELASILMRLQKEEPIDYILEQKEFYNLKLKVRSGVLIPRPETEELVDWVITDAQLNANPLTILDVGTGSGAIAIALSKFIVNAKLYAMDISESALTIAEENARLHAVNIKFIKHNILLDAQLELPKLDIIVSNPPYVRHLEKQMMRANVLNYEPDSALFVKDNNPLIFYKAIVNFALKNLKKNGLLYFEINEYLGEEMLELLGNYNFSSVELRKDLFEKDRMIKVMF